MFKQHKDIPFPANDKRIVWRFMSFTAFVDFLESSSLYFARLDTLEDSLESLGTHMDQLKSRIASELFGTATAGKHEDTGRSRLERWWAAKSREYEKEKFIHMIRDIQLGETVWVNCWHTSEGENLALWKAYAREGKDIALRSTIKALRDSLSSESKHGVSIGEVSYAGERQIRRPDDPVQAALTKHRHLQHEHELRALVTETNHQQVGGVPGIKVAADKRTLVKSVVISPKAQDWLLDLTARVMRTYGLEAECETSEFHPNREP